MEDIGYMARAAYVMDRYMHWMGLHGKSFLPLFLGFGCNVPALMGTRIIESPTGRLITLLVARAADAMYGTVVSGRAAGTRILWSLGWAGDLGIGGIVVVNTCSHGDWTAMVGLPRYTDSLYYGIAAISCARLAQDWYGSVATNSGFP